MVTTKAKKPTAKKPTAAGFDRAFPKPLAELNALEYDYADGEGIDFESFDQFHSAKENSSWLRAWTGNAALSGAEYRVFGQDGTGGYAAFWLVRDGAPLLEQPIVFFGSEGEVAVVARNFADYAWLLAAGVGPMEVAEGLASGRKPIAHFEAFAKRHAPKAQRKPKELIAAAKAEFPKFKKQIAALCM
jgi:hypothetical protein